MNENLFCVLALLLSTAVPYVGAQDEDQDTDFSSSKVIIIAVPMAAVFLMLFFSIYIRLCSFTSVGVQSVGTVGLVAANRGLDSAVLETFPTFAYSAVKGLKIGKGALECAVCLNEFEDDDTLRLLPKCDHVFHPECIDTWLSSHTTCPVCRANLEIAPAVVIATTQPIDLDDDEDDDDDRNGLLQQNSVTIRVSGDQNGDNQIQQISEPVPMDDPITSMNENRVLKSRLIKFARSHSTGHSLIQRRRNVDRFTLRLPEDVREQIMSQERLNQTTSLLIVPTDTSSRRGYRTSGGEGSSRGKSHRRLVSLDEVGKSDWWVFSMLPPFLSKAPAAIDGGEDTSSMAARGFITSLKKSFSRLNSKVTEPGFVAIDSARPPV